MASQITHIVAADKVFEQYFHSFDKQAFYIGTVFPDIRYLGGISRDETHYFDLTLEDIVKEKNSFTAGVKFHCLLDLVREDFVSKQGIYELFEAEKQKASIPKLLEDELLYYHVTNWSEVIRYFDTVAKEERSYAVPVANIERWHKTLQDYFGQPPINESRTRHAQDLGLPEALIAELNIGLSELRKSERAKDIIHAFYDSLEHLIENWHKESVKPID